MNTRKLIRELRGEVGLRLDGLVKDVQQEFDDVLNRLDRPPPADAGGPSDEDMPSHDRFGAIFLPVLQHWLKAFRKKNPGPRGEEANLYIGKSFLYEDGLESMADRLPPDVLERSHAQIREARMYNVMPFGLLAPTYERIDSDGNPVTDARIRVFAPQMTIKPTLPEEVGGRLERPFETSTAHGVIQYCQEMVKHLARQHDHQSASW